jgi:cell division protein FtsL
MLWLWCERKKADRFSRRALGTPLRVEKLAREQLQMRTVTPAITQYARMGDTSASANAPVSDKQVTQP